LKQRILTVLGLAVAVLALYTVAFRARLGGLWVSADARAATGRLPAAVATEATGSKAVGAGSVSVAQGKSESTVEKKAGAAERKNFWDMAAVEPPEIWGSDPFVRDWVMVNELAELNLKAITIGGEKAYALINDQILEEGDQISGKRIVLIEKDKVVLEQGGRTFNLLLGE